MIHKLFEGTVLESCKVKIGPKIDKTEKKIEKNKLIEYDATAVTSFLSTSTV